MRKWIGQVDWCAPQVAWLVAAGVFLLRLPFCFAGPGFDADSYLFLVAAILSVDRGEYNASRGPGYIVPDIIGQLLAPHGWVYLNLLSSAIHMFCIPLFAAILRTTQVPNASILLWLYILVPMNIVGYADVMVEYSLALLGILSGWWFFIRGQWVASTLLWGVGAAMRPSQGVFLFAVLLLTFWRYLGWRRALQAALLGCIPLILLWILPAYTLTGSIKIITEYLSYSLSLKKWLGHIWMRLIAPIGILPISILLYMVIKYFDLINHKIATNSNYFLCAVASIVIILLFLRHPFKSNYLLLGLPFIVYIISVFPKKAIATITLLAVAQNFIAIPYDAALYDPRPIGPGVLYTNLTDRLQLREEIYTLVQNANPNSVYIVHERTAWFITYELAKRNPQKWDYPPSRRGRIYDRERNTWFVGPSPGEEFEWTEPGSPIYATDAVYKRVLQERYPHLLPLVRRIPSKRGI